jgi:hypothetical protein
MTRDPLKAGEGRLFRGNLHCYSGRSDGLVKSEEVAAAYPASAIRSSYLSNHFEAAYGWRVIDTRHLTRRGLHHDSRGRAEFCAVDAAKHLLPALEAVTRSRSTTTTWRWPARQMRLAAPTWPASLEQPDLALTTEATEPTSENSRYAKFAPPCIYPPRPARGLLTHSLCALLHSRARP